MTRTVLIILLLLSSGISEATFEIEDPSKIVEEDIEKASKAMEAAQEMAASEEKVIVPTGTDLYAPRIIDGSCNGWSLDESEAGLDDTGSTYSMTRTTYTGVTMKTINCSNESDGGSLQLSLVRIGRDRLIWVETSRILASD